MKLLQHAPMPETVQLPYLGCNPLVQPAVRAVFATCLHASSKYTLLVNGNKNIAVMHFDKKVPFMSYNPVWSHDGTLTMDDLHALNAVLPFKKHYLSFHGLAVSTLQQVPLLQKKTLLTTHYDPVKRVVKRVKLLADQGYTVQFSRENHFQLLVATAINRGFYNKTNYELLLKLANALAAAGFLQHFVLLDAAYTPMAVQWVLVFEKNALLWQIGLHDNAPQHATTLLMHECLSQLIHEGINNIDLYGANIPSVATFKSTFSNVEVPYAASLVQQPFSFNQLWKKFVRLSAS